MFCNSWKYESQNLRIGTQKITRVVFRALTMNGIRIRRKMVPVFSWSFQFPAVYLRNRKCDIL